MSMNTEQKKDSWTIVKWDFVFNLIVLGSFLFLRGHLIFSYIVFFAIYAFSFIAFKNHGPWIPIIWAGLTVLAFYWVWIYPYIEIDHFFRIIAWVTLSYTGFWVLNAIKNYIRYLKSLQPEICPFCGAEEDELMSHMGNKMCGKCFNLGVFSIQAYHNNLLNYWDYEFIKDVEREIGKPIPLISNGSESTEEIVFNDQKFGYICQDKKITHLYFVAQEMTSLNLAIGSLNRLKILNLNNNRLAYLPVTIQSLIQLEELDLRRNPLDLSLADLQQTIDEMREKGCKIHY